MIRLMAITDRAVLDGPALLDRVAALCGAARPGTVAVQLRDKDLPVEERLALGRRLRTTTAGHGQRLVVGDRLDVALLLDADGVHLGEASVPAAEVRQWAAARGRPVWISAACHDVAAVAIPGTDAVLLSPVVAPRKGRPPLGHHGIAEARRHLVSADLPPTLLALGGVTADDVEGLRGAGADGVAAIGAVWQAPLAPLLAALEIAR